SLVLRACRRRTAGVPALPRRLAPATAALARRSGVFGRGIALGRLCRPREVGFLRRLRWARRAHAPCAATLLLVAQLRHQVLAHRIACLAELLPPVGEHDVDLAD